MRCMYVQLKLLSDFRIDVYDADSAVPGNHRVCASEWSRDSRNGDLRAGRARLQSDRPRQHRNALGGPDRVFVVS